MTLCHILLVVEGWINISQLLLIIQLLLIVVVVSVKSNKNKVKRNLVSFNWLVGWLVGCLSLWYIKLCRLFNAKSVFKQKSLLF